MSPVPPELLIDTFQYLDLNEIEKCQYVNFQWNSTILADGKKSLKQKRRIHKMKLQIEQFSGISYTEYV